jgi:hypothetical protein
MASYKLYIKDPSETERKITGDIVFRRSGPNYYAIGSLNGLPTPFTTTSVNKFGGKTATEIASSGKISLEGDGGFAEYILELIEEIILELTDAIADVYNVGLGNRLISEVIPEEPMVAATQSSATQSSATQSSSPTKSTVIDGSFTFNVEKENTFTPISSSSKGVNTSDIGVLTLVESGEFVFQDDFDQLDELDPEFTETEFDGLSEEEFILQDEITNNINDQEQSENLQSNETGVKVDIQPVSSFDELLKLAGKLARELGKNKRVNYENLRRGYTKGIHGLCTQGTQAVLYALTGVKALGKISGNADWFSFKNPGTGGGPASFSKTGHYNDKVKITQKNGSWKGTYIQDPSQWQIGDIIVMGYLNGKKYGHIQVWTGVKWMSDFKQNKIQQNHVDPNTVALWRLNETGIATVRAQSGNIGKQIS